jgi:hypothetical protein
MPQRKSIPLNDPQDEYNEEDELYDDDEYNKLTDVNAPKFYQIAYYADYFDVSTMDVLTRMRKAIWPYCSKTGIFPDDD